MTNKKSSPFKIETFISGGIAGCVAKSLVAPIDRVKILRQVHSAHYESYGIFESFIRIPQKEGFAALYKGNGAQLLRIFPYAAFQYGSYETFKSINERLFPTRVGFYLDNLACGSLAG
jgi:solute carrier family 25 protein 16